MNEQIKVGARVLARDASGVEHPAVVLHGPARDRFGVRGSFVKYWLRFNCWDAESAQHWGEHGKPWPAEDVRPVPAESQADAAQRSADPDTGKTATPSTTEPG